MKYMGSKNRIAKHILPIMLRYRTRYQVWVEPFVGGGNMIDKVLGDRMGYDSNLFTIEALKLIRDNPERLPDIVTEERYQEAMNRIKNGDYGNLQMDSWILYCLSFGGKFCGGYRRDKIGKRNYSDEAKRNSLKQSPKLKGVTLSCKTYQEAYIPENSIIYCDPPYAGTTKYKTDTFDHTEFWNWCNQKVIEGHTVFVSEYTAPLEWVCIWQKEIPVCFSGERKGKKGTEKLFVHRKEKK